MPEHGSKPSPESVPDHGVAHRARQRDRKLGAAVWSDQGDHAHRATVDSNPLTPETFEVPPARKGLDHALRR